MKYVVLHVFGSFLYKLEKKEMKETPNETNCNIHGNLKPALLLKGLVD